jgi:predicted phage tail protein
MASRNVNVQDEWAPEPELMERPPRRVVVSEYPDLNRPNTNLFYGISAGVALIGVFLLIFGLASSPVNAVFAALGAVLMLVGAGIAASVPQMLTRHDARSEQLAMHGMPIMARIISSDNMAGDNQNKRLVKYQASLQGGELVHKHVFVDDRLLPRRIPASVTALVNLDTNDVELYCALPYRVVSKTAPGTKPAIPDPLEVIEGMPVATTPTTTTGMNTINVEPPVRPVRPGNRRPGASGPPSVEMLAPSAQPTPPSTTPPLTTTPLTTPPTLTPPVEPQPVATANVPTPEAPVQPVFDESDELARILNSETPATPPRADALPRLDTLPTLNRVEATPTEVSLEEIIAPSATEPEPVAVPEPVAAPEPKPKTTRTRTKKTTEKTAEVVAKQEQAQVQKAAEPEPPQPATSEPEPEAQPVKPSSTGLPWE